MQRREDVIRLIAIGLASTWVLVGAGCKTTVQTHPPIEERIERINEQLRQMERQSAAEKAAARQTTGNEAQP